MNARTDFKPGDPVIYRMTKHSRRPGPRARDVVPSPNGDDYSYLVDKFWIVDRSLDGNKLMLRTRRGKTRIVSAGDLNLRAPRWWELLLYRNSFPTATPEAPRDAQKPTALV